MTGKKRTIPARKYDSTLFPTSSHIREQAEQKAKEMNNPNLDTMTSEEIRQMIHELQVKQLEMELQIEYLQSRPKEYDVQAELLNTITENMLDMIGLTDIEGNFIVAGKVHDVLGYESGFLIGKNVMDFVHPEDLSHLLQEFSQLLASGVSNPVEYRYRKMDGSYLWFETVGRMICDVNGTPHQIVFNARDISERKQAKDSLKKLEWMLSEKTPPTDSCQSEDYDRGYGDLTQLNCNGIILKSIGRERLESIASDYLDLLGTSSAIYEVNGDYAFGIFSSGWCQMMDRASRELCNTSDNVEALNSGRWLCHESCWTDCTQKVIAGCTPVDIECNGGIRLYGVPIIASGNLVGVINFGYGDPPKNPGKLRKLADTYQIKYDDLVREAYAYNSRPPFIIELAKKRVHASARIIGSMIETKQAEDALEHSYDLMRYIIEHANSAVAVHDSDLKYVYVSQQYLDMYGVKETDVIGRHHYDVFPDLPDKWRHVHQKALVGKVFRSERDSYHRKDGTLDWTRWECRPWYKADGSIGGIVVYTEIITERVAAEEALRQSENYYRTIFETSGTAMLIVEEDTTISLVNSNFVELSGYLPREIEGKKSWTEFVHPEDVVWMKENHYLRRQNPDAVPRRYEFRFITRSKEMRYVLLGVGMIPGTDQRVASCTDITERKQAEAALRDSEDRYRESEKRVRDKLNAILLPEGDIGMLDLADILNTVATQELMNQFYSLTGIGGSIIDLEGNVLVSTGWQDICTLFHRVHPETSKNCIESDTILSSGSAPGEFKAYRCKNNIWHAATPILIGDKHFGNIILGQFFYEDEEIDYGTFRAQARNYGFDEQTYMAALDGVSRYSRKVVERAMNYYSRFAEMISTLSYGNLKLARTLEEHKWNERAREKLQSQLNQAQKMESVGRLAGGVAHDFNNKLTIINGYAEMAIGMMEPSDPLRETIQEIYTAGNQSAVIVRQLLAFARQQTINPVLIDLNDTISNMLRMLQRLIGENLDLAWHPGNNLWPVKIDPSQVDQIMANLATNARDAIFDVGKLTIETKNTIVDEDYCKTNPESISGRYVMLAVSDDGHGMEKEVRAQLFEPYFTTKEVGKGTGLGLPTIYGIVKQNNGFINVYSEPGEGTTFKIYFPSDEAEQSFLYSVKESSGEVPRGSETILLVEDEPAILKMGKAMIEHLGYTVLTAEDPNHALQAVWECDGTIDLLITDVIMPEMNGRDLSSQLVKNHPGLKTLYMSGYTANVIAHHGVLDEGVQFIQKPFSLKELAVKVREAIEQA